MLDVHPPHERIHGFRDFFLHLLTITIGLLIALGLEACAESVHHRHQREEAESTLREEMRDNVKQIDVSHKSITLEKANLVRALQFLAAREQQKAFDIRGISLAFEIVPLTDASWRTASATGVLSYMEYQHVQRYAGAYHLQDQFSALQQETLDSFLQLHSYIVVNTDPTTLNPQDLAAAKLDVRHAYAHLDAMDQIGAKLAGSYQHALGEK